MIGAVALPVMVGFASLVAEYGHGLLVQAETQRIADAAAYAGALAYSANGTTAAMTSAADAVANLNGIASSAVTASFGSSTTGDGNSAVQVLIASNVPLLLAPLLGGGGNLPVKASSFAELKPNGSPCVLALGASGSGVTLSGGATVNATSCSVASNAAVTIPCGTVLTTRIVDYNSTAAPSNCGGASIKPPSGAAAVSMIKMASTDPLASNAGVTSALASLAAVSSESAPAAPAAAPNSIVGGGDIYFGNSILTTLATVSQAAADGCVALPPVLSSTWTLTCTGLVPFSFGNITVVGGQTVNFNLTPLLPSAAVYYFSGAISVSGGSTLTFGPGAYNIAKGLSNVGGSTVTFGAGTFTIGAATTSCNGAYYSICNTGASLTFAGPSAFMLRAGVYNGGGSSATLGAGSANSFQIGAASDGNALNQAGVALTLGDATGGSSLFRLTGNVTTSGGTCISLGAAATHDIQGNLTTAGGVALGAGAYLVTGYVAAGGNGGGNVTCSGATLGISGAGTTLAVGGASTPSSGACSGYSFCVGGGYSSVVLTAPTTGTYANLVILGPTASSVLAGANLAQGATGSSLSGAVYFRNGPVNLSGGATLGNGASQCLTLIGSTVSLSGGTTAASSCVSGGNSGYAVALVQ
jgi:hypothetical protein